MDGRFEINLYWQFKNGSVVRFNGPSSNEPIPTYTAWDRSLGGWVIYARY